MKLLTAADTARKLRVSTQTLWRWTRARVCPAPITVEGSKRWIDEDLDAWILSKKENTDGSERETQAI